MTEHDITADLKLFTSRYDESVNGAEVVDQS